MNKICFLIHGYLTDYRDFNGLPNELMKDYDQIILFQLPGHNHKSCLKAFTKNNTFNLIEEEMKRLTKDNVVDVIGFSLGGALALYIALKYKINKLVLLSPAIRYLNRYILLERSKYFRLLKKSEIKQYHQNSFDAIEFVMHNTLPKFSLTNGLTFCQIIDEVKKTKGLINVPTLIIRGTLDELVPSLTIEECLKRMDKKKVKVVKIEGIGHMMLRTPKKQEIIEQVKDFLEDK